MKASGMKGPKYRVDESGTRNPEPGTWNSELGTWNREAGFSIVTAVFLLVVLALLGAYMLSLTGLQQASSQLDVQGVRAYQAARAGIEWGAWQVLDPNNTMNPLPGTCSPLNWPATCAASTNLTLAGSLSPFTVTVTCTESPPTTEGNREVHAYQMIANACNQVDGGTGRCPNSSPSSGYVERQITATLSKCKDPTAAAPRCSCG